MSDRTNRWKVVPEYTADPAAYVWADSVEYEGGVAVFKDKNGKTVFIAKQFDCVEKL